MGASAVTVSRQTKKRLLFPLSIVLSSEYECPFGFVSLAFQLFAMFMAVVLDPCSDDFACRLKISHEGRIILEF